jgi:hypothetical protein
MKQTALLAAVVAVAIVHAPPVSAQCSGDCNGNGVVTVDELVTGVAIALGSGSLADCRAMDQDNDESVEVFELVSAVQLALHGCFRTGTPRPSATPSPSPTNPSALTVAITSPLSATVYTRGSVTLQVVVSGNPDTVQLLRNGSSLVNLTPPYQYVWDTTAEDEGTYTITARAIRGTEHLDSDPRMIVVDRTPPRAIAFIPAPESPSVWQRAPISVRFSEPLLRSSVTVDSIRITDMNDDVVGTSAALDTEGTTLTIASAPPVVVPNLLTGTLLAGMTDRAGNPLIVSEWTWTLPDWVPLGAPFAAAEGGSAFLPTIRLDSSEQPVVAWMEFDASGSSAVHVSRWDENQSAWILFERSPPALRAFFPAMVLDDSDRPVLAWSQQDTSLPPHATIHVERWNGTGFEALGSDLGLNAIEMPSIALDGTAILVAWSDASTGTAERNIFVSRFDGATWEPEGPPLSAVAGIKSHAATPSLVTAARGVQIVAWSERQSSGNDIYVANWNGIDWQPMGGALSALPGPSTNALLPALIAQADGTPIVAWSESDGVTRSTWAARWRASTSDWQLLLPGQSALTGARTDTFGIHLALNLDENPVMVWSEGEYKLNDGYQSTAIWVRQWTGTSWEPIGTTGRLKADAGIGNAADPSVVVDSHGSVIVAWDENPETGQSGISVMRYNR